MVQRERLKQLIIDYCNEKGSRTFSLQELHDKFGDYGIIQVGGKTPQATVRRLLQELRDLEIISFLDRSGNYTLRNVIFLDQEKKEMTHIDISRETPLKREYLLETYVRNVAWAKLAVKHLGDTCLIKNCTNVFLREDGTRYIEVHHIIPLHLGGEDALWNLSVLCAHHHRAAHFANIKERIGIEKYLLDEVVCRL